MGLAGGALTSFMDDTIQLAFHTRDMLLQPGMFKHTPQFCVVVDVARVQIVADRPFEQRRILRDDGQPSSQIQQANSRSAEAVNAARKMVSMIATSSREENPSRRSWAFINRKGLHVPDVSRYRLYDAEQRQS
jgi:hypothetical protein